MWQTWSSVVDDVADMSLITVVECVEKQLELLRRLATEHWQELVVRPERRQLSRDVVSVHCAYDVSWEQFTDKSWDLDVQILQQEHVVLSYDSRMWRLLVVVWIKRGYKFVMLTAITFYQRSDSLTTCHLQISHIRTSQRKPVVDK